MNKKIFGMIFGLVVLSSLFASFGSAYHYNDFNDDYVEGYSRTSVNFHGYYGGQMYETTNDYTRLKSSGFMDDGRYYESNVIVRTKTEPGYNYGYNYGPRYYDYGRNYNSNYDPWYQNHWNNRNRMYYSPRFQQRSQNVFSY